jgi:pimeloyl-ACP methyl ester carboxylesterase
MQFELNGFPLCYEESGSGAPLLLIHGFPLSAAIWREQTAGLGGKFRVIAPDLRGFGKSGLSPEECTMDRYADDLIALLDHLGIGRAAVCGMSMGGYVLLNLLERYPERVAAACFMVTRAGADDEEGKARRLMLADAVLATGAAVAADAFSKVLFAPQTAAERPELIEEVRQIMMAATPAGLAGGLLAMRNRPDYSSRLTLCTVPALVIGAEDDLAMPPAESRQLAAGIPGSRLCMIAGAGHMVMMEQPVAVNRALEEFLSGPCSG